MGSVTVDESYERLRVAAVERLALLDTPGEERFDRITRIARELFDVPIAEINLIDAQRQFTKSPQPGRPVSIDRVDSFCEVTVQRPDLIVVPDATKDDRFSWRSPVSDERHVRFYAGRPLSLGDDMRVGTLCLVDTAPRAFSEEQRRLLDEMGSWVERELKDTADLDRAAEVQRSLLPQDRPGLPDFEVVGMSLPAKAVGGDFYSWHGGDGSLEFTVADVMGKGTAGAIIAAAVRSAFQSRRGDDVVQAVDSVNAQLARDLEATGSFATLLHGAVDLGTGRVDYADAGHGLTVVVRADGSSERLEATGLPIGILADGRWGRGSTVLAPGDRLIAFTDGLLDLYRGTLDCLPDVVDLVRSAEDPRDVLTLIAALVAERRPDDDVTAVVVSRAAAV